MDSNLQNFCKITEIKFFRQIVVNSCSGSQTFSNRYPNQGSDYILLPTNKNFSHFLSKMSFPMIAHTTEQHRGFGSALPPEEPHITPGG